MANPSSVATLDVQMATPVHFVPSCVALNNATYIRERGCCATVLLVGLVVNVCACSMSSLLHSGVSHASTYYAVAHRECEGRTQGGHMSKDETTAQPLTQ